MLHIHPNARTTPATRAEIARATRTGHTDTDRGRLRREVRAVAVGAANPGDFVERLGVLTQDLDLVDSRRW